MDQQINSQNKKEHLSRALTEIIKERFKQDEKWGANRNHPSVDTEASQEAKHSLCLSITSFYHLPAESLAKRLCDLAFAEGRGTWAHIAVEELAEAVEAKNDHERRHELVQLAAVIVAWIEAIDRASDIQLEKAS